MIQQYLQNPWLLTLAVIIGFFLLVYSADWLVDGASAIAKRFHVSELVIGLTIVAFGTSMPEFVVNMVAAIEGNTEIAITNILGSNTINVFVILGLSAIIYPVRSQAQSRHLDIPLSLVGAILVLLLTFYTMPYNGTPQSFSLNGWGFSRIGGIILLLFFVTFLSYNVYFAKKGENSTEENQPQEIMHTGKAIMLILLGFIGLVLGGQLMVDSATVIAVKLGVSDAIIGLTVVALGTSLPELATSCMAAAKKNSDLAIGNVVGSNIFNIFFILGTSAVVRPLPAYMGMWVDASMVILGSLLIWLFVGTNKAKEIKRWEGAIFVIIYGIYLTYRILQVTGNLPAGVPSL